MPKVSKIARAPVEVRTRRAYFDCRFGQLHVRTAFPTTGGFDEQATLFCLHSGEGSSRVFAGMLPQLADVRSVYAPDLPGHGESDASPSGSVAEAATAVAELARDLRLRQIDLLGLGYGASAAVELAREKPELVRKLVLISPPSPLTPPRQPRLTIEVSEVRDQAIDAALEGLAKRIDSFFCGRS